MVYQNIFELIGNTPILEVPAQVHGIEHLRVFAKLEYYNPFGSLKDRMAWQMIKNDLAKIAGGGRLVIENSSGNTAKALQIIASICGSRIKTITNRIKNPEKKMILQLLGAEVEELPGRSQCYDPSDPNDPLIHVEREIAQHPDRYVYTNQYFNPKNTEAHYLGTGKEILQDLGRVDYIVSGLGTSGSLGGIKQALREANPDLKVIGAVSLAEETIPGIRSAREMWEVGLYEQSLCDEVREIKSADAIEGSLALIRRLGILAGPTAGAAYQALLEYFRNNPPAPNRESRAVFLACDRFEWYLSYYKEHRPELFGETPKRDSIKKLGAVDKSAVPSLAAGDAPAWIAEHKPLIIDIRSNIAYRTGSIPDSLNIPETDLESIVDRAKPFPLKRPLLLVCPTGDRSLRYAYYLTSRSYRAYNLEGGILEWRDRNFPLESISHD